MQSPRTPGTREETWALDAVLHLDLFSTLTTVSTAGVIPGTLLLEKYCKPDSLTHMLKTEIANTLLAKYGKKNAPAVKAGDTVRVYQKIKEGEKERVQIFEGLVIAVKHGRTLDGSFTVRKIAAGGIGVERTYPLHSPNVVKVERTKTAKVSRAKLYYMRDRRGKNARFKVEESSPMTWAENPVVAEELVAEPDTMQDIVAEVVEVAEVQEELTADLAEGETVPEEAANPEQVVAEEAAE